ncbi:MAG: hypothetical protein IH602_22135 [Bryobacteraceae bacterium]|nr:hypothetical protein [Bryobacteraceae bacterium]
MSRRIEQQSLEANLAALNELLETIPEFDYVGRMGIEQRRDEVAGRLTELKAAEEERFAEVALFFGGDPVFGSRGISAGFVGRAIGDFQDLITKLWATDEGGNLTAYGPIKDVASSRLHVTEILHGSFGFILEELDEHGAPMFDSPLKQATARATSLIQNFVSEGDVEFEEMIETVPVRVFSALKDLFKTIRNNDAVFRLVEGETDLSLDEETIERAYRRAEAYDISEDIIETEAELLGVLPIAGRFELKDLTGQILRGKVGTQFSQEYLERIEKEQLAGKRWLVRVQRREKRRVGKPTVSLTLLELHPLE